MSKPELNQWLRDHFHPHYKIRLSEDGRTFTAQYYLFTKSYLQEREASPVAFTDPEVSMANVRKFAKIYLGSCVYKGNERALTDQMIDGVKKYTKHSLDDLQERVNSILDQAVLSTHKSMVKCSDSLYNYICGQVLKKK